MQSLAMFTFAASVLVAAGAAQAAEPAGHTILRSGDNPSVVAPAKIFTGRVRQDFVAKPDQYSNNGITYVTFEPGARTFWHDHPVGQRLLVVSGKGLVGTKDRTDVVRPGDYIWCPPGVIHWHGAAPDTAMTHIAMTNVAPGKTVTWFGALSEDEYKKAAETAVDPFKK